MISNVEVLQMQDPEIHALPVSAYFDEAIFAQEMQIFFKQGTLYVGHELMVPEIGSYHVLEAEDGGRVLVRSHHGIELLSNVCRHRQSILLKGRPYNEYCLSNSSMDIRLARQTN